MKASAPNRPEPARESSDRPVHRAIDDRIGRFTDPRTRALLASDDYTMPLLEAALGTALDVRVLRQDEIAAARLPDTVRSALRVSARDRLVVRRSRLVDRDLVTASVNLVVGVRGPAAVTGVDDVRTPIGHSLISRGLRQRRHVLRVGLSRWPDGRPCATKAYTITLGDRPLCYIREAFNPAVIPPDHLACGDEMVWNDEPHTYDAASADTDVQSRTVGSVVSAPLYALSGKVIRDSTPAPAEFLEPGRLGVDLARASRGEVFVLHLAGSADAVTHGSSYRDMVGAATAVLSYGAAHPVAVIAGWPERPTDRGDPIADAADTARRAIDAGRPPPHPGARHIGAPIPRASFDILRRAAQSCGNEADAELLRELSGLLPPAMGTPVGARELHSSIPRLRFSRETTDPLDAARSHRAPERGAAEAPDVLWTDIHTLDAADRRGEVSERRGHPVVVTLDPTTTRHDVVRLCRVWNPENEPGVLTLVPAVSTAAIDPLEALFEAAAGCGTPVTWLCDPLNGDASIGASIRAFRRASESTGTVFGGVHVELASGAVVDHGDGSRFDRGRGIDPHDMVTMLRELWAR